MSEICEVSNLWRTTLKSNWSANWWGWWECWSMQGFVLVGEIKTLVSSILPVWSYLWGKFSSFSSLSSTSFLQHSLQFPLWYPFRCLLICCCTLVLVLFRWIFRTPSPHSLYKRTLKHIVVSTKAIVMKECQVSSVCRQLTWHSVVFQFTLGSDRSPSIDVTKVPMEFHRLRE